MIIGMTPWTKPNHIIGLGVVFMVSVYALVSPAHKTLAFNNLPLLDRVIKSLGSFFPLWIFSRITHNGCCRFSWVLHALSAPLSSRFFRVCCTSAALACRRPSRMSKVISTRRLSGFFRMSGPPAADNFQPLSLWSLIHLGLFAILTHGLKSISLGTIFVKFRDGLRFPTFATLFGGHGTVPPVAGLSRCHPTGASFYHGFGASLIGV